MVTMVKNGQNGYNGQKASSLSNHFSPSSHSSHSIPAAFTGKPIELGGSQGREEATGFGGVVVLKALLSKLKGKAHLIALFGSQARGHATFKSDIDLLIIHKDNQSEIFGIVREVKSKSKIQPVTLSLGEFKSDIKNDTLFYKNIKSDSIILHLDPEIKKEIAKFLEEIQYEKQEVV